jgi:hypothetical protein
MWAGTKTKRHQIRECHVLFVTSEKLLCLSHSFPTFIKSGRNMPLVCEEMRICAEMYRSDSEREVAWILVNLWWVLWTREWTFRFYKKRRKTWPPHHLFIYKSLSMILCLRRPSICCYILTVSMGSNSRWRTALLYRCRPGCSNRMSAEKTAHLTKVLRCLPQSLQASSGITHGLHCDSFLSSSFICH